jgi:hypothetical protein
MPRLHRLRWLLPAMVAALALACSKGHRGAAAENPDRTAPPPPDPTMLPVAPRELGASRVAATVVRLPEAVGAWKRTAIPRTISLQDISEYMDGAGELYLAYRFDHLDVYDYASQRQGRILVELFWMEQSDDAFGLLSSDWTGESLSLAGEWARAPTIPGVLPYRALYVNGLLRMWCNRLYARVLASTESPASRRAIIDIGRAVAAGQAVKPPPPLLAALPAGSPSRIHLRSDHVWFLRSYLVLNSAYFLATENLLNLEESAEAVVAPYDALPLMAGRKPGQLILVRYATAERAGRALTHFREGYLPESVRKTAGSGLAATASEHIEDGWVAYRVSGRALSLACECRTREQARYLVETALQKLEKQEEGRGE